MRYYSLQYKDEKKLLTLFNVCHLYCFVRFECARFENMELGVTGLAIIVFQRSPKLLLVFHGGM